MPDSQPARWDEEGRRLMLRARSEGDPHLLLEAIALFRQAIEAGAGDHLNLGVAYGHLYDLTAAEPALRASCTAYQTALLEEPESPRLQSNMGQALTRWFEHSGDLGALEEAVRLLRMAVARTAEGTRAFAVRNSNLGQALTRWHERTDRKDLLTESIEAHKRASELPEIDSGTRAGLLVNLGNALMLAVRGGEYAHLPHAIETYRRAVEEVPEGHEFAAGCYAGLGDALVEASSLSGSDEELREATRTLRQAVELGSSATADLPIYLSQLAAALRIDYGRRGDAAALEEGIELLQTAMQLTPSATERVRHLASIGLALRNRFEYSGDIEFLEESAQVLRRVLEEVPADHARYPKYQSDLALTLFRWGEHTDDRARLAAAADLLRSAATAAPPDHPDRVRHLVNLGSCLVALADLGTDVAPIAEAIQRLETALDHAEGAVAQAECLINLAAALDCRFRFLKETADDRRATEIRRELTDTATYPLLLRAMAARDLGNQCGRVGDFPAALDAFGLAVELLDLVAWRGLHRDDQERLLSGLFPGLASAAAGCAMRADDPVRAVELLEQGRSVLLAQVLDVRTGLEELQRAEPELAAQLAAINWEFEQPLDMPRRRDLAFARDRMVTQIRGLPEFTRFLLPPSTALLHAAAAKGPIILVNVSEYGCGALVITPQKIRGVLLPLLDPSEAVAKANGLLGALRRNDWTTNTVIFDVLAWLWDSVAEPILDTLDPSPAQHVWWVPTGPLTVLPLHAAGRYRATDGPTRCVPQRVISSYTPTIRVLHQARASSRSDGPDRPLVVTVPFTVGQRTLPRADEEGNLAAACLSGELRILRGSQATRANVLAALASSTHVHFASHATSEAAQPSESSLELVDGPLYVREIMRLRIEGARLAFLSACETAYGGHRLPDETIHVASAFQLAGFSNVIGTLWSIDDGAARSVSELWYRALVAGHPHAVALHLATEQIRQRYPANPALWAAHIHVGDSEQLVSIDQ